MTLNFDDLLNCKFHREEVIRLRWRIGFYSFISLSARISSVMSTKSVISSCGPVSMIRLDCDNCIV